MKIPDAQDTTNIKDAYQNLEELMQDLRRLIEIGGYNWPEGTKPSKVSSRDSMSELAGNIFTQMNRQFTVIEVSIVRIEKED